MYPRARQPWDALVQSLIARTCAGEAAATISRDLNLPVRLCHSVGLNAEAYTSKYRRSSGRKHRALLGLETLYGKAEPVSRERVAISAYLLDLAIREPDLLRQIINTALRFTNPEGRIVITPGAVSNPSFVAQTQNYLRVVGRIPHAGLTTQLFEYRNGRETGRKTAQLRALNLSVNSKVLPLAPKKRECELSRAPACSRTRTRRWQHHTQPSVAASSRSR